PRLRRTPDGAGDATAQEAREHAALSRRRMFRRLLIANRGEIAIRVARTARAMGIHCIGVYSEADRTALHRTAMDESVEIGGPLPVQSYLNPSAILRAARETRADAIHPGYGFLSEKADFAVRCAEAGIVFVGPPPEAIAVTGDKVSARRAMAEAGVPVTEGVDRVLRSVDEARGVAGEAGSPVPVEATASPAIGAAVRRRLQEVAVRGLQSLGYRNAGTVEFLFHDRRFTFNEVNARLQVEHPITEMVTGVDLVRQQLRVASGEGIEFSQNEMRWKGHAIECRINAEDPLRNFLPSPGRIVDFRVPAGSQIRVDAGVAAGSIVPAFYDPLIAKLVVGGSSRDAAVRRMLRSVDAFEVRGIHSTLPFHRVLLSDRDFIKGKLWTTMVDDLRLVARIRSRGPWEQRIAEIAAAVAASGRLMSGPTVDLMGSKASAWSAAGRRQLLAGGDHAVPPRRRW